MKTTRRTVLTHGGKAIAAAAVLPFLLSINPAQAQEDAGLFALYDEYRRLEKEYEAAQEKAGEVAQAVHRQFEKGKAPQVVSRWSFLKGLINQMGKGLMTQPRDIQQIKDVCDEICDIEEKWQAELAEAESRAGAPALEKKETAACDAWHDALIRFIATRAKTPAGMILKFHIAWCDKQRQDWEANHLHAEVEFWDDAMASVLIDLERLSGRPI